MTESNAARIAFVGAGNHATESLYPNIAHVPEFDLVAVCDLVDEKARSAARRFGAPEWFTDVETMLGTAEPDGVCICGPPDMHYQVGLQALGRGIPVFMEKPPALTLKHAEDDRFIWRAATAFAATGHATNHGFVNFDMLASAA